MEMGRWNQRTTKGEDDRRTNSRKARRFKRFPCDSALRGDRMILGRPSMGSFEARSGG